MRSKIIVFLSLVMMLACLFVVSASAEDIVANTITNDTYGTIYQLNADPGLDGADAYVSTLKNIVDSGTEQETLSILYSEPYYYVFPTSYIINEILTGNEIGKFEYITSYLNTALSEWDGADDTITLPQFELTGSWSGTTINSLVRIEFSKDVLYFDKRHCLVKSTALKEAVMHDNIKDNSQSTHVFKECAALEKVRFSSKCTQIHNNYFESCTSLTEVTNIDNITSIGQYAFFKTNVKSINAPNLKSIDNYAFKGSSVESITTEKVTYYGQNCFEETTALKTVVLNENLTTIPTNFFKSAKGITHITIPASVTTFNGYSFQGCSNLTEVNNLSDGFTHIAADTFSGTKITSFRFPSNLASIGQNAFAGCSLLESVELPSTVTTIEQAAFKSCTSLTYFKLPEGVTIISHDLFKGCKNIVTLVVPRGCTSIYSQYSVDGMSGLKTIIYTGAENSDFIVNHVNKHLSSATVVYSNHCDVYYAGVHTEVGEPVYSWLDKEGNQGQPFLSYLKVHTACGRECGAENVKANLAPLFVDRGFAYGPNSMLQGVAVNKALLAEYANYFTSIKYGLVAAAKSAQTSAEIIDANGNGVNNYVAAVDFTEREYDIFDMNLCGITESYKATEFYFGAYVIADGQVYYIHNGTTNEEAQAITYNEVVVIVDATVPENKEEEENA